MNLIKKINLNGNCWTDNQIIIVQHNLFFLVNSIKIVLSWLLLTNRIELIDNIELKTLKIVTIKIDDVPTLYFNNFFFIFYLD